MSFDYSSYNSLTVPLNIGTWESTLMLRREYNEQTRQRQWSRRDRQRDAHQSRSRSWTTSWSVSNRDDDEDADERQREADERVFALYFRPSYDLRTITGGNALQEIQRFLSDCLNVAHWNLPTDNTGIEGALKQAVADGKLVSIIEREHLRTSSRTCRPSPATLRWTPSGGGYVSKPQVMSYGDFKALQQTTGEMSAGADYAGSGGSSGFGLMAIIESAASVVLGSDDTDAASADDGAVAASDAGDDTSTPLGDAQLFDYTPDAVNDDTEDLAASTNNPNYAAKMLGYDRKTFGDILHDFKPANGLGPADNVIWHDNGDVYFNGNFVANFHDWAN